MLKQIALHEQLGGDRLAVAISVQLGRKLTDDENLLAYSFTNEMVELMQRNNHLQDPVYMANIAESKEKLLACFPSHIYVKEIENGYSKRNIEPWYVVTTSKGPITIGWRKRVIQIDWSKSNIKVGSIHFPSEDVTKGDYFIHAWGYEKAKEYITLLLNQ